MWRPWGKSTVRIHRRSLPPSSSFSCSSFKDIQDLCTEETLQTPAATAAATSKRASIFHRVRIANSFLRALSTPSPSQFEQQPEKAETCPEPQPEPESESESESDVVIPDSEPSSNNLATQPEPPIVIPGAEKRIVVYFTSLNVVRSTFYDCKTVRSILRGFRVSIDERDLSMDSRFLTELQGILGQSKLTLPRVFIGGRYIGGAEEVRQLNETGELKKLIVGLPVVEPGVCDVCGGHRFILCDDCNGSHKLYTEKAGFKTCTTCNENGLIRCSSCSCATLCSY
ncbi:putative Glutaredoxin family protein [Quillaja saponaria]|uniref:Glutaredoxin family protein n=1 Tax=Quillaja saponaria TaxID=32244 RepID=A0AAD7LKI9_QUISA|nr:putative Glutaredoxin family protein [Quillaja saponaria]